MAKAGSINIKIEFPEGFFDKMVELEKRFEQLTEEVYDADGLASRRVTTVRNGERCVTEWVRPPDREPRGGELFSGIDWAAGPSYSVDQAGIRSGLRSAEWVRQPVPSDAATTGYCRSVVRILPERLNQCQSCAYYHGEIYGGKRLVCTVHPNGPDGKCSDWEGKNG